MNVALQSCCCRDRAALVESFIARLAAGFGVGASPEAVQRANALLCELSGNAALATIDGAAHFAIATHAVDAAGRIAAHVIREPGLRSPVSGCA
jgi:hypothetical protein